MTNTEGMESSNGELIGWDCVSRSMTPRSSFVIRKSFVIGYFVIRHSPSETHLAGKRAIRLHTRPLRWDGEWLRTVHTSRNTLQPEFPRDQRCPGRHLCGVRGTSGWLVVRSARRNLLVPVAADRLSVGAVVSRSIAGVGIGRRSAEPFDSGSRLGFTQTGEGKSAATPH